MNSNNHLCVNFKAELFCCSHVSPFGGSHTLSIHRACATLKFRCAKFQSSLLHLPPRGGGGGVLRGILGGGVPPASPYLDALSDQNISFSIYIYPFSDLDLRQK